MPKPGGQNRPLDTNLLGYTPVFVTFLYNHLGRVPYSPENQQTLMNPFRPVENTNKLVENFCKIGEFLGKTWGKS